MRETVDLLLINPGNRVEQFANLAPLATVAQPLGIVSYFIADGLVELKDYTLALTSLGSHFAELIASVFDGYTNESLLVKLKGLH